MQNVSNLLQKLTQLAQQAQKKENSTLIDIELMLDHTRALYADLLELRASHEQQKEMPAEQPKAIPAPAQQTPKEIKQPAPERKIFTPPRLHKYENTEPAKEYHAIKTDPTITKKQQSNNLKSIIGVNDKYLFISELFNSNKDAYDEVINELERFDTYDQASNWLNTKVYNQYGWDEQSETVQSFYYVLSQYFASI